MGVFEDFVNRELPRRPVMLTETLTGYTGDPNDPSAPDIIDFAPEGSFFLDGVTFEMWRKQQDAIATWVLTDVDPRTTSKGDMTFPVDYTDGTAVDPPPGTKFVRQSDIDGFLSDQGATNFKHLQACWDTVPQFIVDGHIITFNCAAGVHRPQVGLTEYGWDLSGRDFFGGAYALVQGAGPTTWPTKSGYAGLTVVGYTGNGSDPALQISGVTLTPGELKGCFLRVDNSGQVTVIHDNTADTIYVTTNISPSATTVTVKDKPSTIFRNAQTDVAQGGQCFYTFRASDWVNIRDMTVDPWNYPWGWGLDIRGKSSTASFFHSYRWMVDCAAYYEITGDIRRQGSQNACLFGRGNTDGGASGQYIYDYILRPPPKSHDLVNFILQAFGGYHGPLYFGGAYIAGSRWGMFVGSSLNIALTVIEGLGDTVYGLGGLDRGHVWCYEGIGGADWGYGKLPEMRNFYRNPSGPGTALFFGGSPSVEGVRGSTLSKLIFSNIDLDYVIRVTGNKQLLGYVYLNGAVANTGIGIHAEGPNSVLAMTAATDISGTVGEVELPDGTLITHADLKAISPIVDLNTFSIIEQDS